MSIISTVPKGAVVEGINKNLLDNWYFGNPINQRGEQSYTATQNGYTIDRWYCNQPRGTVGITNSVIQLIKATGTSAGSFQFTQKVNSFNAPCTFSVLLQTQLASGVNISIVDTNNTSLASMAAAATSGKQLVTCYYDGTSAAPIDKVLISMTSGVAAGASISLYAVKLELGNQQTLCHNEGTSNTPIWVFNEVQDYDYEFYRCRISTADSTDTYANKSIATEQQIAIVENDIVASQAYNPGQYFCWNGLLYRCTVAINTLNPIIPGTNCEVTTASELFSGMYLDSVSVSNGNTLTITFPSTGSRANGLISITGSSAARTALYAFSGLNGATPSVTKLSGADLDSLFSTASGSISFTPNYGSFVMILSINNTGRIVIS